MLGPGKLFTGVFGATEPADSAVNAAPAASAWSDVGGTMGGLTVDIDQTFTELEVDQIIDSVGHRPTKRAMSVTTSMAEKTLGNLSLILNGGTTGSGAGWASYDPLTSTLATQPAYIALIVDGWAPGGAFTRRAIARKCLSTAKTSFLYAKDKQDVFACTFSLHYVSPAVTPIHWVDQTS